jgi:hypothetical protein
MRGADLTGSTGLNVIWFLRAATRDELGGGDLLHQIVTLFAACRPTANLGTPRPELHCPFDPLSRFYQTEGVCCFAQEQFVTALLGEIAFGPYR